MMEGISALLIFIASLGGTIPVPTPEERAAAEAAALAAGREIRRPPERPGAAGRSWDGGFAKEWSRNTDTRF